MAEKDDLLAAIKEIPSLLKAFKEKHFGGKEKFAEIKVGDKTYSYTGAETFGNGVELKDCPDGEYQTDTHQFTVKAGKVIDYKEKPKTPVSPDPTEQQLAAIKTLEGKLTAQKTEFESQIKEHADSFNKKFDESNGKLKEMFDLIEKIAILPSVDSKFKKKDGEPSKTEPEDRFKKLRDEAKALSEKTFRN